MFKLFKSNKEEESYKPIKKEEEIINKTTFMTVGLKSQHKNFFF